MRLGLFGGTFDPVHVGHLLLADTVRSDCGLDRILFIPAAVPPHKREASTSSIDDRYRMVGLAIQDHPGFQVSDLELRRTGASYTADTVLELESSQEWKGWELFLILGADMLIDFVNWKNPDEILKQVRLLVMERPGYDVGLAGKRFLSQCTFVKTPLIDISSSQIRRRICEGKSIRYWVPKAVERFILEKGLYRS
jgi:nicotinate-nucleotide adenylyltransferase